MVSERGRVESNGVEMVPDSGDGGHVVLHGWNEQIVFVLPKNVSTLSEFELVNLLCYIFLNTF